MTRARTAPPADDVALLTGDDAGGLLQAALQTEGGRLLSWSAHSVDVRPAEGTTVSYRAEVAYDGQPRTVWLGASTHPLPPGGSADGALLLTDAERTVAVWPWPRDPWLPALRSACDAHAVEDLLASFGAARAAVRLRVHSYRPGRRAVLEARSATGRLFVKVVRPERVLDLHRRHRLLQDAGLPVPASLGWSADGLLVLTALPGTSAREHVRTGGPLPDPRSLLDLLDRLPGAVLELPRRPSWTDGARHYATLVHAGLTAAGRHGDAARATRLADRIADGLAGLPDAPEPVHGDLYEAQLLLDTGGAVTGLLDVDAAGPGRRADDLACVLAHLEVLATLDGWPAGRLHDLVAAWRPVFETRVDAHELALRTVGVLLSLATGPHRVQQPDWPAATARRLDAAERWLRSAGADRA